MTMPSAEKYATLIAALRVLARRVETADKNDDDDRKARLVAGFEAVQEVVVYLAGDCDVREAGLTRPLAAIENVLRDASRGAAPALLRHSPEGRSDRPTGTTREEVQGGIVAAVQMLKLGGWGTRLAAEEVARLAAKAQLRCADGSPIRPQQVRGWQSEHNRGGLPARARAIRDETVEYDRAKPWYSLPRHDPAKRAAAEQAARSIVKTLAATEPRTAPSPTARLKEK